MKRWTHASCFGGVMISDDVMDRALIEVGSRCAYSTALKTARRMVRLLNAGEEALKTKP